MTLELCSGCQRHIRSGETCPFCRETLEQTSSRLGTRTQVVAVAACIGVALTVCGCYGPPPQARAYGPEPQPNVQAPTQQTAAPGAPSGGYSQPPATEQAR
jgi:hypothetical protein